MNNCEAVEDASISGDVSLPRHGGEAVFASWESEGLEAVIVFYIILSRRLVRGSEQSI